SLEDECDDDDEEDLHNVFIPQVSLKRCVATASETLMSSQADKQREAIESARQAAAIASIACIAGEKVEDDEEDPLDKYMESIAKESVESSGTISTINDHHADPTIVKTEPMDTNDQSFSAPSLVTVHNGVAKSAKEKGLIMEQNIDGLEYSSKEESIKLNEDLNGISAMNSKKSKLVS
ncbi:unnamed protein product, partial [Rotaria sordida]